MAIEISGLTEFIRKRTIENLNLKPVDWEEILRRCAYLMFLQYMPTPLLKIGILKKELEKVAPDSTDYHWLNAELTKLLEAENADQ